MQLSKQIIKTIHPQDALVIPDEKIFALPEKVLQFGTGVLLRGLPDYFIDKANRKNIFNGRIVVIKSMAGGDIDAFERQDGLYTLCVRGVEGGHTVEENIIHSAISRVLSAATQWDEILQCAANPAMQVIISNTTEVGIVLDADDNLYNTPPRSFPVKLLAFLYKRYRVFNGDRFKGMVVIPTELIPGNGDKLKAIVKELAHQNNLENVFMDWLENANHFCNSLVDRIVPGKLPAAMQAKIEAETGYTDELMIMSEAYRLWAIESEKKAVKNILTFSQVDKGVVIAENIEFFRELKLRLLNGSHTFSCGLAYLAGFHTVKDAMNDENFSSYITQLMMKEIAPSITGTAITIEAAKEFAVKLLDRFRNPDIAHEWLGITMQYSSKMKLRNIPVIKNYIERFGNVPGYMTTGIAAHLLFMKCEQAADGKYYGRVNEKKYVVNDDNAEWFANKWKGAGDITEFVTDVLKCEDFWGFNFADHPQFINSVANKLKVLKRNGAVAVLKQLSGR